MAGCPIDGQPLARLQPAVIPSADLNSRGLRASNRCSQKGDHHAHCVSPTIDRRTRGLLPRHAVVSCDGKSPVVPKDIAAAVADPARPQADRDRDADRKPAECIAFAGLKPGQHIADLIPGGGYFTRIFSGVVGPKGKVFAIAPPKRPDAPPDRPEPAAAVNAIAADPHYKNVTVSVVKIAELKLPEKLDMVWTSQNYHDVHNVKDLDVGAFNKAVFDSLKPGGTYIVIDHAAEKGAGFAATSTLHRKRS